MPETTSVSLIIRRSDRRQGNDPKRFGAVTRVSCDSMLPSNQEAGLKAAATRARNRGGERGPSRRRSGFRCAALRSAMVWRTEGNQQYIRIREIALIRDAGPFQPDRLLATAVVVHLHGCCPRTRTRGRKPDVDLATCVRWYA